MLNHIFVSTDDNDINKLARNFDIQTIFRPKRLCTDNSTSESALLHALDKINNEYSLFPEIIVFLQATSPLRLNNDIDNALKQFLMEKADSLFSVTKMDDLTIWQKKKNKWMSFNFDYKNRLIRQMMPPNYIENGSIYIFKPEILKKYNNRIGGKVIVYEMEFWQTWEIDSIKEIDLIEYYILKYSLAQHKLN